jgi:hypothetical protein
MEGKAFATTSGGLVLWEGAFGFEESERKSKGEE